MSIVVGSSSSTLERPRFIDGMSSCIPVFESADSGMKLSPTMSSDRRFKTPMAILSHTADEESVSCSSSIGRDSESLGRTSLSDEGDGEAEVQSSYKGPLDTMDALEESLPIRRGISKFYCGKSKSFTSLSDAASSSVKDLVKPENPYNRKRKNLLASNHFFDKSLNHLRHSTGSLSKKLTNSSRRTGSFVLNMSSAESNTSDENASPRLPPLHPQAKTSANASVSSRQWTFSARSLSLTDLQSVSTSSSTGPG